MGLYDVTVDDLLIKNKRLYPDRVALVCGELRLTFRELDEQVEKLARGLRSNGLGKGDRVAVLAQNCHKYFILYGAAARLGAIMLPINWRLSAEEIEYILNDCTPKILMSGKEYIKTLSEIVPRCPFILKKYCFTGAEKGFKGFEELTSGGKDLGEVDISSEDGFVIVHTAAVEGKPRGALLSHGNIVAANMQAMSLFGLTENDAGLILLPLFHIAGLGMAFNVFHCGGKNVIMAKFDAEEAVKSIQNEKISIIGDFAPILSMLLEKIEGGAFDVSSLKHVSGLDHPDTIKKLYEKTKAEFWVGFGQTETGGFVTAARFTEKPGSAGKESPFVRVRLVDEYDNEVEVGKPGEITVRGPIIFRGYWNLEEVNRYTFRGGWHHTGDVGRFDENGYLWYVKRKAEKELIKPGGENVYPAEVEKVILQNPDVAEVSVIGVRDQEWGEAIKAVCVLKPGSSLTEKELIDFVAARIARYKKPKFVQFLTSLPKLEDGAIDREKVKAAYGSGN